MLKRFFEFKPQPSFLSLALLILRLAVGIAFILHGWSKIQTPFSWMPPESPVPGFLQLLAAVAEFGGGFALILGLLTPLASLGLVFTMAGATVLHAIIMRDPFVNPGGGSYELSLIYLCLSLVLIATGPGKYSLDAQLFKRK